jgi:hypothetical protein
MVVWRVQRIALYRSLFDINNVHACFGPFAGYKSNDQLCSSFPVLRHVRLLPSKPLMPLISDHHSPASYPSDPRFPSPLSPTIHSNLSRIPPCHFLEGFSLTGGCAVELDDDDFEDCAKLTRRWMFSPESLTTHRNHHEHPHNQRYRKEKLTKPNRDMLRTDNLPRKRLNLIQLRPHLRLKRLP